MGVLKKIAIAIGVLFLLLILAGIAIIASVVIDTPVKQEGPIIDDKPLIQEPEEVIPVEPEEDFFEKYWRENPDEDPCNDPTAKAFGLCQ